MNTRLLKNTLTAIGLLLLIAQKDYAQQITLEDIFDRNIFSPETVRGINWMNDGQYYTSQVHDDTSYYEHILKYDITSGNVVDTLVNGANLMLKDEPVALTFMDYALSPDEQKVLLATELEPIYRRSTKAYYYLYDIANNTFEPLAAGDKQSYATFSPDGSKVAFARDNNLFIVTLADMSVKQVTQSGQKNKIINGSTDWVYEEEFGFAQAFYWSPKSDKLAFLTFDESAVKEYDMQWWGGLYPTEDKFKYPKAGEQNSVVGVSVYQLAKDKTTTMDIGKEKDMYLPRVQWTQDDNVLSVIRLNRLQNQMELLHANASTGQTTTILTEKSKTYVDIEFNDNLTYLKNGKQFIHSNEEDGYKHLYLYDMQGNLIRQITQGNWEVSSFLGIDEQKGLLYYLSTEVSPLQRQLYSINIQGKKKQRLTRQAGTYDANFSPDFRYYIQYYGASQQPLRISLHQAPSGKQVRMIEDNKALQQNLATYNLGKKEFFTFTTDDQVQLNGYMIKPADFDSTKQYPVLMYVYGGPGSQTVTDDWISQREAWFYFLAQKGYIVASIDNRGTGGRGKDFRQVTYTNLGKYEVQDQIAGAKYLGSLPYIDQKRVGIWGWSYGGYMTLLSLLMGNDVFTMGVAVAPVTNWRFYDTVYTERYLQTPQLNAEGYDKYSPINHAAKLEGDLLLIHGTGDDNVHFQNSIEMVDALVAEGKQFESFYYPNRNHGIYGGNTRMHLFNMITDFVLKKL